MRARARLRSFSQTGSVVRRRGKTHSQPQIIQCVPSRPKLSNPEGVLPGRLRHETSGSDVGEVVKTLFETVKLE